MKAENGNLKNELPAPKKPSRWKKFFAVTLIVLLSLSALLFIGGIVLEKKIKSRIVSEINEQVVVPVEVKGGITLSLFRHFPYASVSFADVSITDKLQRGKQFLSVKEFSLLCNIWSLFGNEIEFSKIFLRDGELNLFTDERGRNNFDILKPQKENSENKLTVQIKKAQLKNVRFRMNNRQSSTFADVTVKEILLNGNFNERNYQLDASANVLVNKISVSDENFLGGKKITAEVTLDVNKTKKKYNFSSGKISVEDSEFDLEGFLQEVKNGTQLNFKLKNEGSDVKKLFALFPQKYMDNFVNAEGSGAYSIEANVNGLAGKNSLPKIAVSAELKDSEMKLGKYNKLLKEVNATAKYELDETGKDKITISNFNCTLNNNPFQFKLALENLSNPVFDFYANGILSVEELQTFIPDSSVQDMGGTIEFRNFSLKGKKDDFTDVENSTLEGSGEFDLKEVEFRAGGVTYGNISGLLKYENKIIDAHNFTLNFLSTDFNFSGTIENLFAFVYNLSEKRKANNVVLGVNGKVKTQTFNLSGILEAFDRKNRPQAQLKEKINIRDVLSMKGNLDVEMGQFIFRKMTFENLQTNVQIVPALIQINSLTTKTMEGNVKAIGQIAFTPENSLHLKLDISAVNLSLPEILLQCENFGQQSLTEKHVKGIISVATTFNAAWKNYKELDENSLAAVIDFSIKDGELIQFEPLRAASKFIRVEELSNIKFSELKNTIQIKDRRLDLPEFEVKTSALNLMLFGTHYFDNTVDYHFKINLHKMLAQKFNRNLRGDVQYMETDPYEGLNLYLTMTGKLDNPKIKYDKSSARKKVAADFRNEKEVLKNLLHNKTAPVDENEKKSEEKHFDVKEQPEFLDLPNDN